MIKTGDVTEGVAADETHDLAKNMNACKFYFLDLPNPNNIYQEGYYLFLKIIVVWKTILLNRLFHNLLYRPLVNKKETQNIFNFDVSVVGFFETTHDLFSKFLAYILSIEKFCQNTYFFNDNSLRCDWVRLSEVMS